VRHVGAIRESHWGDSPLDIDRFRSNVGESGDNRTIDSEQ
jgi:hypothetical protein